MTRPERATRSRSVSRATTTVAWVGAQPNPVSGTVSDLVFTVARSFPIVGFRAGNRNDKGAHQRDAAGSRLLVDGAAWEGAC
jgi:hypothetical protein